MQKQNVLESKRKGKILKGILYVIISSLCSSVAIWYFVKPANFAPIGFDGIATMIAEIANLPIGVMILAVNTPLLIASCFLLDRKFTVYTVLSILFSSAFLFILEETQILPQYDGGDKLLPAIFSGVMLGVRTGLLLKIGASSGGVDILAAIIQKKNPYINFENYIAYISYAIMAASYFVYWELEAVMLSVIQMFVFERAAGAVMKSLRNAVEFKIITDTPDLLKNDILSVLKHGATVVEGQGMFTGEKKTIIFCVVNTRQVPEFLKLLKKYDRLFVYSSDVSSVNGNFRWLKDDVAK